MDLRTCESVVGGNRVLVHQLQLKYPLRTAPRRLRGRRGYEGVGGIGASRTIFRDRGGDLQVSRRSGRDRVSLPSRKCTVDLTSLARAAWRPTFIALQRSLSSWTK